MNGLKLYLFLQVKGHFSTDLEYNIGKEKSRNFGFAIPHSRPSIIFNGKGIELNHLTLSDYPHKSINLSSKPFNERTIQDSGGGGGEIILAMSTNSSNINI